MRTLAAGFAALSLLTAAAAQAGDLEVRSDLPLWTDDLDPEPFTYDNTFGCSGHVSMGTWERQPPPAPATDPDGDPAGDTAPVLGLDNYGVFHCAYIYRVGHGKAAPAFVDYAWIKRLEPITVGGVRNV